MKNYFFIILIFLFQAANAQLGNYFFGGIGEDCIYEMSPSPDGNFYAIGTRGGVHSKIWLMKVTHEGELLWEKILIPFKSNLSEKGYSVNVLNDGSLIITGEQKTNITFSGSEGVVLKTDENGNLIWSKLFPDISAIYDASPQGANIMICGWYQGLQSSMPGIVMRLKANGDIISRSEIKIKDQNFLKKIIPLPDGNFLLAGRANDNVAGFGGIILRKVNAQVGEIWTTSRHTDFREAQGSLAENSYPMPLGVSLQSNGNIWVTNSIAFNANISLMQYDPDGGFIDDKNFGNADVLEYPYAILPLSDNGLLITGSTADNRSFALRMDNKENQVWYRYYTQQNASLKSYDIEETKNGFLMCGRFQHDVAAASDFDGWLSGIQKDGNQNIYTIKGKVVFDENKNCQYDEGEMLLSQWFVEMTSDIGTAAYDTLLLTDADGTFEYKVDASIDKFSLANKDTALWNICSSPLIVHINHENPMDSVAFLVQLLKSCSYPEISLTQPDFIRCDTSCIITTINNKGSVATDELLLNIALNENLSFVNASLPYNIVGDRIVMELAPIERLDKMNIDMCFVLDCDVPLGSTQTIDATLVPIPCQAVYTGPKFKIDGYCDGQFVIIKFSNTGGGGSHVFTSYDIIADGIIIVAQQSIDLPEGSNSKQIDLPADGRTWRVVLKQSDEMPDKDFPTVTIEGCGKGNNGLYSTGYAYGLKSNDPGPERCIVHGPVTTGIPNKIAETVAGLGYYNIVSEIGSMEFSLRTKNLFNDIAQEIVLDLRINKNLDLRTFQLLSAPDYTTVSISDTGTVILTIHNLFLAPKDDAMVRFRIFSRSDILPDRGSESIFFVRGNAYFDGKGPVRLNTGFTNYSFNGITYDDPYNHYPSEFRLYGGRTNEFDKCMAKSSDGGIFLAGSTDSYGANRDGWILKINSHGEAEWEGVVDARPTASNSIWGIVSLQDGGCIVVGTHYPQGSDWYFDNSTAYYARIDRSGAVLWVKDLDTPFENNHSIAEGIIESSDHHFIIFGRAKNDRLDQFYVKIDDDGNIVWSDYFNLPDVDFTPIAGIPLNDGSCVFLGNNSGMEDGTDVYLQKINIDGDILWSKGYNSEKGIELGGFARSVNGDFMVAGYSQWYVDTNTPVITPTFIKFSSDGIIQWEKNPIYDTTRDPEPYCILALSDGGFLISGDAFLINSDQAFDVLLMKIDDEGEIGWIKNYGAKNYEFAGSILEYSPDEIFLWGNSQPRPPFYNLQGLLIKTDEQGELTSISSENKNINEEGTFIFPNPASNEISIILSPEPTHVIYWTLFDITGRIIKRGNEPSAPTFNIKTSDLQSGTYFITFPGSLYPGQQIVVMH